MKIRFCGAASGVTGSCHLISTENHKILLDCGQFQGSAEEEAENYRDFPFDPAEVECVVVSHAHIDHCGRLPLLVKRGFKGRIYASDATADLLTVMLNDSAHIHETEAEQKNRKNQRAGKPLVEPLYTAKDAEDTLKFVTPVTYDTLVELNDQMKIVFNDAGHILGSAIIELWVTEGERTEKLVFSGDIGMDDRPILKDPVRIKKADHLIMETTYGDRNHEPNPISIERLFEIVAKTVARGGNVVIPSFAVGRTQELIFEFNKVYDGDTEYTPLLRKVPVYVDSPMAMQATQVFRDNAQVYDDEMKEFLMEGDHPLDFKNLHFTRTSAESQAINSDKEPKIIISASGMCDAGRIRHHLKHNLWNEKNSIVFVGYQVNGTLGRLLLDGTDSVKLFGEEIAVRAEIYNLGGFSGHADRDGLFSWLGGFIREPKSIFLVHGETEAKEAFAEYVEKEKGWKPIVVNGYSEYDLDSLSRVDMVTGASYDYSSFDGRPGSAAEAAASGSGAAVSVSAHDPKAQTSGSGAGASAFGHNPEAKTPGFGASAFGHDPQAQASGSGSAQSAESAVPSEHIGLTAEEEFASEENIEALRERIADIHDRSEKILSNAELALSGDISAEKISNIRNAVSAMEKAVLGMSASIGV